MRPAQMRRDPSSPAVTHRNAPKPPLFRRRAPEMRLCQRRLPLTGWRDCLSLINTAPQPTLVPRRKPDAMRAAMIDKAHTNDRSEEHTSELQSLMSISYAVFCLKKK